MGVLSYVYHDGRWRPKGLREFLNSSEKWRFKQRWIHIAWVQHRLPQFRRVLSTSRKPAPGLRDTAVLASWWAHFPGLGPWDQSEPQCVPFPDLLSCCNLSVTHLAQHPHPAGPPAHTPLLIPPLLSAEHLPSQQGLGRPGPQNPPIPWAPLLLSRHPLWLIQRLTFSPRNWYLSPQREGATGGTLLTPAGWQTVHSDHILLPAYPAEGDPCACNDNGGFQRDCLVFIYLFLFAQFSVEALGDYMHIYNLPPASGHPTEGLPHKAILAELTGISSSSALMGWLARVRL